MSDSLQPHRLQHARLLYPPLPPRVCSNSCPFSQWWYPTISSSVVPFSFCLHSFSASGSFPMSWLFETGGKSTGAAASTSFLPMNIHGWFPLGLTGLSSLQSKGLSSIFSSMTVESINSSVFSLLYGPTFTSIHDYWKNHNFDHLGFLSEVMSLLFNMLCHRFLSKEQACFNFMAVCSDFGAQENKICHFPFLSPFAMKWWHPLWILTPNSSTKY